MKLASGKEVLQLEVYLVSRVDVKVHTVTCSIKLDVHKVAHDYQKERDDQEQSTQPELNWPVEEP